MSDGNIEPPVRREPKSIKLKVQDAVKRDVGKSLARIDQETMEFLGLSTGDIVELVGPQKRTACIAWPSYPQDQGLGIIRIDSQIRKNIGASLDEMIEVKTTEVKTAKNVTLAPISFKLKSNNHFESFVKRKLLTMPICLNDYININIGMSREFVFKVVNLKPNDVCVIKNNTVLTISEIPQSDSQPSGIPYITYEDIGGLDREIVQVREMIELPLKHPELFQRLGIDPPKGVLLRGPPGCGKTLLAKAVANETNAHFISINGPEIMSKFYGESEKKLRSVFKESEEKAPSIIFIDEIDAIAPKRESVSGEVERRVVAQLLSLMDGLETRGRVVIIGATNRPNAVDPALRRPGRFDREIDIKVPDENGRLEILHINTRKMPLDNVNLIELARITHGYVGADLAALCREAAMSAMRRYLPQINPFEDEEIPAEVLEKMFVIMDDFNLAFKDIIPSGIREVFVEVPKVHWSDIGGHDMVKQQLIEAVEWPLKNPEAYKRMGVSPPAGVLLYGPPGCGKTMLAKAVATESEANFISIKGPEIYSKWVGESEKAIREIFRKARLASPCIIFFDEIDSIAVRRGMITGDSGVSEKVLSQMLTELDGIQSAGEICIIAATNRPDILDPAIIRPGRIDRLCYVPPPGDRERLEIFKICTKNMPLKNVDINKLVAVTKNFTGADIENMCREAAIRSLRKNIRAEYIELDDFLEAAKGIHPSATKEVTDWYEKFEESLTKRPDQRVGFERRDLYT